MFLKKVLPLFIILLLIISNVGCSKTENKTAAIVNGEKISISDYEAALETIKASYQQQGIDLESEQGKELMEQLKQQTLDNLIGQKLLQQEAIKKDYEISDEEINESKQQIKGQYSEEQFKQILEEKQLTESELEEQIENQIRIRKYVDEEFGNITVTDEEAKSQYDLYKKQQENLQAFDEIKADLKQQMKSQKMQEEIYSRIEELKDKSDIEILL